MKNFNDITIADEALAKEKFREYGQGVTMTQYATARDAKWEDLVDPTLFSVSALKSKMLDIARKINTACNDELLGDLETAFSIKDARDKTVKFTWTDIYTFLRAAYRFRIETAEYRAKAAQREKLRAFVEANKSVDQKLADATAELALLDKELA